MNAADLWRERSQQYWHVAMRYLRLMASSGLMVAIYGTLLIIGLYYQSFLEWLPADFPALQIFTVLFAFLLTRSPVRTFLKEGDLVFLLPFEAHLGPYMRRSLIYSWMLQSAIIFFLVFLLAPLYIERLPGDTVALVITVGMLVLAKLWNILAEWGEARQQFAVSRSRHRWLRLIVNLVLVFFLLQTAWLFMLIIVGIMIVVLGVYYRPMYKKQFLKWETLLEQEHKRLNAFYRFANAFTDVRHVKAPVHRRRWLANRFDHLGVQKANTYLYLYGKTFARSGDYFGIFIRLAIVGGLLIYASPGAWDWLVVVIVGLFIYMTGAQMVPIYFHHDVLMWPSIYPVPDLDRRRALKSLVRFILLVETFWFTAIAALTPLPMIIAVLALLVGIAICLYYTEFKLNKYIEVKA